LHILIYVAKAAYTIAAVLMVGAILLQEGKGGGLSALGGTPAESAFGASNPIRRMTVVLAAVFFLIAVFLARCSPRPTAVRDDEVVEEKTEATPGTWEAAPSPAEAEPAPGGAAAPAATPTPDEPPAAAGAGESSVPGAATPGGE